MPNPFTMVEILLFFGSAALALAIPVAALLPAWKSTSVILAAFFAWFLAFAFVAYELDFAFGVSVSWLNCLILAVIAGVLAAPFFFRHRSPVIIVGIGLVVAGLILLHFVTLSPVKPFRRFYASTRAGMTKSEVFEQLARQFPHDGHFPRPVTRYDGPDRLVFALDSSKEAYNAELVRIDLKQDKVVAKAYLGD